MTQLMSKEITVDQMTNRLAFVAQSPYDSLYVYEEDGLVLGTLGFRIRENIEEVSRFGEISVIVVDRQAKRKGIGKVLMDYADKLAKEHECKGTWLVSGLTRVDEAHKFYKELGYEVTGSRFVKKLR
ncbi:GNAT family N-acetyltransferase [Bacillus sp. FJAT-26390]|uniref:GNAT family N-acetyltransferase n=1 Tax=Bacillus sp. FJAT-26390 TaxID=1743142 RepID=UPI000807A844|nr:GNAT family N-acetyltransferase [Bacillus sp. FJAT-26390]OBZ10263.1 GCN5 family acetyltransferase [Bacillus sp. FJAT-26390]